jgi:ribosome maturation factor RimP
MIEPSLRAMGYRLVRVVLTNGRRARLQVMAERDDEAPITVEDCAQISHSLSALLDIADPITGAYTLEISSPGIDRPLAKKEDYDRFAGREARIELSHPIAGQRRFRGRLMGTSEGTLRLALPAGEMALPLASVVRARLVAEEDLALSAPTKRGRPKAAARSRTL